LLAPAELFRNLSNMLMTTALAARRLGVAHERLLDWVAQKLLPIAGEDEEGRVLLREHVIVERGEALAAEVPERLRSPRLRRLWASAAQPHTLPCGCVFAADAAMNTEPLIRCADARALDATARLAAALAAAAPGDLFFRRLAEVTRVALACHFAGPAGDVSREGGTAGATEIDLRRASYCPGPTPSSDMSRALREDEACHA
jgi:hypothetical protein